MQLSQVDTRSVSIRDYAAFAPADQMEAIARVSASLQGVRVVHISASARAGGVAEVLRSLAPLMSDAGIQTRWVVPEQSPDFAHVAKRVRDLLQGLQGGLSPDELAVYLRHSELLAHRLDEEGCAADVWVIHDPQMLPLVNFLPERSRVVWVCHIDTTRPSKAVLAQLLPLMRRATRVVFSMPRYIILGLDPERVRIVPPAIDPLAPKNTELEPEAVHQTLIRLGVDPDRPVLAQVGRFDRWRDPWGVIDAYRMVKREQPGTQLALLGLIDANDDPEAFSVLESVRNHASGDQDIHLFSDAVQVGPQEVAAFQKGADVVIHKAVREGFGLSVAEALWKGTPVVGGNCGGIRLQIEHGTNGFLVDTVQDCGQRILELLTHPRKARWMGIAGRESVRQRFLMPRMLLDYLTLIREILSEPVNGAASNNHVESATVTAGTTN